MIFLSGSMVTSMPVRRPESARSNIDFKSLNCSGVTLILLTRTTTFVCFLSNGSGDVLATAQWSSVDLPPTVILPVAVPGSAAWQTTATAHVINTARILRTDFPLSWIRRSYACSVEVVTGNVSHPFQRPESFCFYGTLAVCVLQNPLHDQSRRADDEYTLVAEQVRMNDRL